MEHCLTAVVPGKPFIAVTLNYRLAAWGFITSMEVAGTGNTNLGLRDQRLALHWIQENIRAFGGDPNKVTIWGESAGAMSVGYHLIAYGGRDDGLFRAGILESGGPITPSLVNITQMQNSYDLLVAQTNCSQSPDSLQCMRELPFETLNAVLNNTQNVAGSASTSSFQFSSPVVDGDLIRDWGSVQLNRSQFVKVAILAGTNTDEGASFGPVGINTTEQFSEYLTSQSSSFNIYLHVIF
jgi:cholinesterase